MSSPEPSSPFLPLLGGLVEPAGVEAGQLAFVLPVAAALAWIRSRSPLVGARLAMVGSGVVALAGAYWFVQRVFFPGSGA